MSRVPTTSQLGAENGKDYDGDEEDEDSYRRRVYGTTNYVDKAYADPSTKITRRQRKASSSSGGVDGSITNGKNASSFRRLSHQLSQRSQRLVRRSSSMIQDSLPESPAGWTVLVTALLSAGLGYEVRLQQQLTAPPVVFCQASSLSNCNSNTRSALMDRIYQKMTATHDSILSRPIQPALFLGTRGMVASTAAYLLGGPSLNPKDHVRFREVLTMTQDGAQLALDWEVPRDTEDTNNDEAIQRSIRGGPIRRPVVIILHGINNDASFGYMRSLQRTYVDRGWVAAGMNFRGCGGVPMTTPRGYHGAYTGDVRNVVLQIAARLASSSVPIFLVGNSLGANILTKYLGEEGAAGTLPPCVAGAASLGNPLLIHSGIVRFPFNVLMALGIKKIYLENWHSLTAMKDFHSKQCIRDAMLAPTIGQFDQATSPIFIRNDNAYPFGVKIGYENGESYWFDASSYRYLRHISVPFLNLTAQDDFLVSKPSRNKLGFCVSNPNVMVVETKCGGHLGWQGKLQK